MRKRKPSSASRRPQAQADCMTPEAGRACISADYSRERTQPPNERSPATRPSFPVRPESPRGFRSGPNQTTRCGRRRSTSFGCWSRGGRSGLPRHAGARVRSRPTVRHGLGEHPRGSARFGSSCHGGAARKVDHSRAVHSTCFDLEPGRSAVGKWDSRGPCEISTFP
jgi:hypothetical protein